jgi:HSP20 family protein
MTTSIFTKGVTTMSKGTKEVEVKRKSSDVAPMADWIADWPAQFAALRSRMNRLFDDFGWPDSGAPALRPPVEALRGWREMFAAAPALDMIERDGEYELQAELPGMSIKDVDVTLNDGMLFIKGEKSSEHKEDKEGYRLQERTFGAFHRSVALPRGVDGDKVTAVLENGVLKVKLPKTAEAKAQERKIEVKAA